ncbi:thioredoxin-disulfide reductase [bacterium]|jgi:thioredoxin reductase (NADPH)|nr:thioredoxin-disulfide reductase [bacterium]|tara:strand:+ start:15982 stop:16926 length:945 start_codon:yes stop_codon:yes gene_type:complete
MEYSKRNKVVIIGSGPAGLTAAIYCARANLNPIVFEGFQAGGQLTMTTDVENFPGFPDGVMGPNLMDLLRLQAQKFGAKCIMKQVDKVDLSVRPFKIESDNQTTEADSIIISTGASAKLLGIKGEEKYVGRGLSTCATCDGFFYKDKSIHVIGGGDSAMEEAIFLTKFASKVTIIHRRDTLRASKIMAERAISNPKIDFIWNAEPIEFLGNDEKGIYGLAYKDNIANKEVKINTDGVFIAIGHNPNTALFEGMLDMDSNGYLVTDSKSSRTNVLGVFASGDVQDSVYRQAITAAGSGCMAAIDAERFLEEENEL